MKTGILFVSFGTTHKDTRVKTLDAIEEKLKGEFSDLSLYKAWTSSMVRKKVLEKEGIKVNSVAEAVSQMKSDGIERIVVQPTHVMKGLEYDVMCGEIDKLDLSDTEVLYSEPLISCQEDLDVILKAVYEEIAPEENQAIVLMGHGSNHAANSLYARSNERIKTLGLKDMYMSTVEGTPSIEDILPLVKASSAKKVVLTPFLIVAGAHAKKDLSGDGEDSWKVLFERAGYEVTCVLRGLGEYTVAQEMIAKHCRNAMTEGKN